MDVDMLQSIEKREEFEKEVGAGLCKETSLYPLFLQYLPPTCRARRQERRVDPTSLVDSWLVPLPNSIQPFLDNTQQVSFFAAPILTAVLLSYSVSQSRILRRFLDNRTN